MFWSLFAADTGIYPAVKCVAPRLRMRRRAWIERYFRIRDLNGVIRPLVLNAAQRKLECLILRMERAGLPVRVVILKARQEGISTYVQALMFERALRTKNFRGLIIANNGETAKLLLQIAEVARSNMPKGVGPDAPKWAFKMRSKARAQLEWEAPMMGQVQITSAEAPNPGIGGTRSMLHLSEFAKYPKPEEAQTAVLPSLPMKPGTFGFKESTAENVGDMFYNDFWDAWPERNKPLRERENPWSSMFLAWWEHDEYRYSRTVGNGQPPSGALYEAIKEKREPEEDWLLKQRYVRRWRVDDEWEQVPCPHDITELTMKDGKIVGFWRRVTKGMTKWRRRGVGRVAVDVDQLAWRRLSRKEYKNDRLWDRDFPSRPEIAFMSSGRPVFDLAEVDKRLAAIADVKPLFQGSIRSPDFTIARATDAEIAAEEYVDAG